MLLLGPGYRLPMLLELGWKHVFVSLFLKSLLWSVKEAFFRRILSSCCWAPTAVETVARPLHIVLGWKPELEVEAEHASHSMEPSRDHVDQLPLTLMMSFT